MTREEFIDIVYSELHSDDDNCRANRIIDAADEYAEKQAVHYMAIEAPQAEPKTGELYFIPGRRSGLLSLLRDRYERKHGMTKRFLVLCNRGEKMTKEEAIKKINAIKEYLTAGNPIWDVKEIDEVLNMAIEAIQNEGIGRYEIAMQKLREMPRYLNGIKEKQMSSPKSHRKDSK